MFKLAVFFAVVAVALAKPDTYFGTPYVATHQYTTNVGTPAATFKTGAVSSVVPAVSAFHSAVPATYQAATYSSPVVSTPVVSPVVRSPYAYAGYTGYTGYPQNYGYAYPQYQQYYHY